jgi:hypothetical protein
MTNPSYVAAVAAPDQFVHPRRRPADNGPTKRMCNKPDYYWSTNSSSKHLVEQVLPFLLPKLKEAAAKYRLVISNVDDSWLVAHKGRFMLHHSPHSTHYLHLLNLKMHKGKSHESIIQYVLSMHHTVIAESPRFSQAAISANYCSNYESWLAQLWNFLAIIGDYDSMLLLLSQPSENSPSVNFASLQSLVLHKFNFPMQPLMNSWNGGEAVLDVSNRPVMSEGSVNNCNWFHTLYAALNLLHSHFAKEGNSPEYTVKCDLCYAIYWEESNPQVSSTSRVSRYSPCPTHTDSSCRYCCKANPFTTAPNSVFKSLKDWIHQESNTRQYKAKSKDSLLPSDFFQIHTYVKSHNFNTWDLSNYTMLLGAVYYAGRFDGYSEAKLEDFSKVSHHFSIHNNLIHCLAQQVFEKCDSVWHTYLLYFNNHAPEICYLRHLLVHVHCLDLMDDGTQNLFPCKSTLEAHVASSTEGCLSGDASYTEGLSWLKDRVRKNLTNPSKLNVGMHTPRHTFYLWGVLCNTPREILKKNARHKSDPMVDNYIGDAQIIQQLLDKDPLLKSKQRIGPPMKDLLVTGCGTNITRLNEMSATRNPAATLPEAAKLFVESMLHVPPTDPRYRDRSHLLELSYQKCFSAKSAQKEYMDAVNSLPSQELRDRITSAFNVYCSHLHTTVVPPILGSNRSFPPTVLPVPDLPPAGLGVQLPAEPTRVPVQPGHSLPSDVAMNGMFSGPFPQAYLPAQPASVGVPFGPCTPAKPSLQVLEKIETPRSNTFSGVNPQYTLPYSRFKVTSMQPKKQILFLNQVVKDVLCLGRSVSANVFKPPQVSMSIGVRQQYLVAHYYKKGKSLIPVKTVFCRVIDPFFECLLDCCSGDITQFQQKYPNFHASTLKKEKKVNQCVCNGRLQKPGGW